MHRPLRPAYGTLDNIDPTGSLYQQQRGEPNYVRCPRCTTALAAPAGSPTALCGACGQLMMVPLGLGQGADVPTAASSHPPLLVTCNRCKSLLQQPADATVAACGACHNVVTFPARQQMAPPPVVQQQASVGSGHLSSAGGGGYGGASWSGAPAVSAAAKGGESRGQPARDDQWTQWPAQQSLGGGPNSGPSPVDWQQAPPLQRPRERRDQVTCPYCRTELRVPPDAEKMLCGVCRNVVIAPDA